MSNHNFKVQVASASSGHGSVYVVDGIESPRLYLKVGITYQFNIDTKGHPFYITIHAMGGTHKMEGDILGKAVEQGILEFTPEDSHVNFELYYQCNYHLKMGYKIIVEPMHQNKIYHLTSIDGLYNILNSGYISSRTDTNASVGLSSQYNHRESGNFIYVSLNSELPGVGRIGIQLVLSFDLLKDRKDYFLNYEWAYGKQNSSLPPSELDVFLKKHNPLYSEIIFTNKIPLDKYLIGINVVQMNPDIVKLIPEENRLQTINIDQIPIKYRHLININIVY